MASVKVAVRVRPFNSREQKMGSELVVNMEANQVILAPPPNNDLDNKSALSEKGKPHSFTFDHSYWSHDPQDLRFVGQATVFNDLGQDVVKNAFDGYNVCVFAYGQTGSGKTFTMMGSETDRGLIPRICETMFERMTAGKCEGTSYRTEVSYLEIYNERVKDLLKKNSTHNLKVREHPSNGPYVQDLSKHLVIEYKEILRLMEEGNNLRTTAATNMNDTSSRSHAIFTITFVQAGYLEGMPHETLSKIHLVDLAGSERANATGATGQRLKEGAHINKSLVTLGSVISALAEASCKQASSNKSHFIPYRDSVLTWLLKDSLGGNSKTIMIATISPADINHNETLSTLRYANRAKNIINKPTVNEDANVKLIRDLRAEIDRLKAIMSGDPMMLASVQEQLAAKEAKEQKLTAEWNEKWREAAKILQEHNALGLKRTGLGVVLDSDKPHLIGLDEDILSTGITLYQLKDGDTLIGSAESTEIPHILLKGPSVLPVHCRIRLEDGVAHLHPAPSALCLVNASSVVTPVRLSQGCVIVLGKTNMFRYNDPLEAADMRKSMNEKTRKASLMNQSLLSQSLSDLRNPPGSKRASGEWRMFSSDSDIKDIKEGEREPCSGDEGDIITSNTETNNEARGSNESVNTLKNPSATNSAQGTPRARASNVKDNEEASLLPEEVSGLECIDENANPRHNEVEVILPSHHSTQSSFVKRVQERYRSESPLGPGEREIQIPEHVTRADSQISVNKTLLQPSQMGDSTESYENVVPPQKIVPSSDSYIGNDKFERLFSGDHIVPGKSSLSTGSSLLDEEGSEFGGVMACSAITHTSDGNSEATDSSQSQQWSPALSHLYQDICEQKDVIMACLDEDKCDIDQLNAEIAKLQSMQHKYSLLEFQNTKSFLLSQSGDEFSFLSDKFSQMIEAEVDRRLEVEAAIRAEKERDEKEMLLLEKEQELERLRIAHEREMYLIKKKLSTTSPPNSNLSRDGRICITIPSFYTVGLGKQSYVSYEINIKILSDVECEDADEFTLHRRYRTFRELHSSMCSRYGPSVQFLQFPSRKIFGSKSESVSTERQRELTAYLNRLVSVLTKLAGTPLYQQQSRLALQRVDNFFQVSDDS